MNEWQQRVITEHAELKVRIEKLTAFLESTASSALSVMEQHRLIAQLTYMKGYEAILNERIGAFM